MHLGISPIFFNLPWYSNVIDLVMHSIATSSAIMQQCVQCVNANSSLKVTILQHILYTQGLCLYNLQFQALAHFHTTHSCGGIRLIHTDLKNAYFESRFSKQIDKQMHIAGDRTITNRLLIKESTHPTLTGGDWSALQPLMPKMHWSGICCTVIIKHSRTCCVDICSTPRRSTIQPSSSNLLWIFQNPCNLRFKKGQRNAFMVDGRK